MADRLDEEMTNTRTAYERNSENIKKQIVELSEERADVVSGISPKVMALQHELEDATVRIGELEDEWLELADALDQPGNRR